MGCGGSKASSTATGGPGENNSGDNECHECHQLPGKNGLDMKVPNKLHSNITTEVSEHCKLCSSASGDARHLLDRLRPGQLFCDPEYAADSTALFFSQQNDEEITWKRPMELVGDRQQPHLLVDGVSKDDIKQGILGDCWFLSSCAAVSQQEKFMKNIIPSDQPLFGDAYQGMVHFRFWRFGGWIDVYIDDLLPTKHGQLIYARCEDPTEFWVALIEKAYAKLHGSYEALEGGQTMDALVDLTGGLAERYEVRGADPNLYRVVQRAHRANSFIACSRKGDWRSATQADDNGLVSGHAYTITNVMRISHRMGEERLLRIRNPWGNETEWKGSWSDKDSNWDWVEEETRQLMGVEMKDDGEFWMSFKDFCRHFQEVTVCTTSPDQGQTGNVVCIKGAWRAGLSAGGSRNDLEKFSTNPQYILTLSEPDVFDPITDDPENEGKCSVVVALMQEHQCSPGPVTSQGSDRSPGSVTSQRLLLQIGFIIYQTQDAVGRLPAKHFRFHHETGKSGIYKNLREVSARFELEPGHYCLIPSTFLPGQTAAFMLRVYAQKKFTLSDAV